MADLKITELTEVTAPVGTDLLPIVSGGATKKVKAENLRGLPEAALSLADNTTNDVSTARHGFAPKRPTVNPTNKWLRGDGTWAGSNGNVPAGSIPLATSDNFEELQLGNGLEMENATTLGVVADSTRQKVNIQKGGTNVGTRPQINLIEGSNVTITAAEDNTNNRINVTIAATGGGGGDSPGGADGEIQRNASGAFAGSHLSQSGNQIVVASGKQIKGAIGSAAAPSFAVGQDDLGFFRSAADVLGISHYGTKYAEWTYQMLNLQRDDAKFRVGAGGGNDVDYTADGSGNAKITVPTGKGWLMPGNLRWLGRTSTTAAPTTTELPNDKDVCLHKDTAGNKVYLAYNDGGTIKKVELA